MKDKTAFTEVQKMRQWWLWTVVYLIVLLLIGMILFQVFTGNPVSDHPASNAALLSLLVFIILPIVLFFYLFKLTVRIDKDVICYGFSPKTN